MKYFKKSGETVEIPCYLEESKTEPKAFITAIAPILKDYTYKPATLVVPKELYAGISESGDFLFYGVEPTMHINVAADGRPYVFISKDDYGMAIPYGEQEQVWLSINNIAATTPDGCALG